MPCPYARLTSETFLQFALILCRGFITVSTVYLVCPLLCERVCTLRCSIHMGFRTSSAASPCLPSSSSQTLFIVHSAQARQAGLETSGGACLSLRLSRGVQVSPTIATFKWMLHAGPRSSFHACTEVLCPRSRLSSPPRFICGAFPSLQFQS